MAKNRYDIAVIPGDGIGKLSRKGCRARGRGRGGSTFRFISTISISPAMTITHNMAT